MIPIDPNLLLAKLKSQEQPKEITKPGDTGDDIALPPDPGSYVSPTYMEVAAKKPIMPFPDNHNPNMDFVNRWPTGLPPAGIMNDLKPQVDPGGQLPLPPHIMAIVNGLKGN